jgi:hypothetical protein
MEMSERHLPHWLESVIGWGWEMGDGRSFTGMLWWCGERKRVIFGRKGLRLLSWYSSTGDAWMLSVAGELHGQWSRIRQSCDLVAIHTGSELRIHGLKDQSRSMRVLNYIHPSLCSVPRRISWGFPRVWAKSSQIHRSTVANIDVGHNPIDAWQSSKVRRSWVMRKVVYQFPTDYKYHYVNSLMSRPLFIRFHDIIPCHVRHTR